MTLSRRSSKPGQRTVFRYVLPPQHFQRLSTDTLSTAQEPFSIGAVMIAAARQALYKRLSSATMAYPPGQVAPAVKQFFDTRRASFDYFLGMRTTLDPAELSYLLAECDHLDKVKWFIAKKRGEGTGGNFVDPREIVRFPCPSPCFEYI